MDPGPPDAVAVVAPGASLGRDIELGARAVVHEGTVVGDCCAVGEGAVLGKRPRLAGHSSARGAIEALELGPRVTVGAGAVVNAGAHLGEGVVVGDQAFVRERTEIAAGAHIGRGSIVDNDVRVGARARVESDAYLTAFTLVEEDVLVGAGVTTTNDNSMARHDGSEQLRGATLRRGCRIGAGAVLLPGVEIGAEAVVAPGAVVTRDVGPRTAVAGVPARIAHPRGDWAGHVPGGGQRDPAGRHPGGGGSRP